MALMAIKVSEPQNSTVKPPTPYPQPPASVSTQRTAHKRRAVAAVSDEGEDDLSDGMSDVSEAPSNVSAVEGTSTSRRDKRRNTTFNTISAVLTKLQDSIAQISSRLDRLERPVAHPKSAKQAPASAAGALIPCPRAVIPPHEPADQHRADKDCANRVVPLAQPHHG